MKRIRIVGLCLVAVFAMSLAASGTASAALPEWGKCVAFKNAKGKNVGKYTDAGCTQTAFPAKSGGFEWQGFSTLPNTEFTSHGGAAELQTTFGIATDCQAEEAHGRLTAPNGVAGVEVIFKGCAANLFELNCDNSIKPPLGEEPEGQIRTRTLKGRLAYISGKGTAEPNVGLVLEPEEKKGLFAEFICGGFLIVRVGADPAKKPNGGDTIIAPFTPVNKMATANTQTYNEVEEEVEGKMVKVNGIQNPTSLEDGKPDFLETEISDGFGVIPFTQSAQVLTTVNTLNSGEKLEARATVLPAEEPPVEE